jgi:nucleoside-diphosphate-sugar epimerase
VTGVAGFFASRISELLLDDAGHTITKIDNLNDAYNMRMKEYRLAQLQKREGFELIKLDIGEREEIESWVNGRISVEASDSQRAGLTPFQAVINLASRARVRTGGLRSH